MTEQMQAMKRRLIVMLAIDGVCALIAGAAAIGFFMQGVGWMQWAFMAALGVGFAAQIWFIAGFRRANKGV
ncbi:hypothetical protein [Phenylobacterium sp.]|uniref:hypothetical protein n=1 Tax=Phenylobacterium sp. TaxID=1871053 RepID=UPI00273425C4|nr:hypothetical protein [Phenylobacterium sp.]MDP3659855.1 hypothetical protein [Phenylobacterium sp.]